MAQLAQQTDQDVDLIAQPQTDVRGDLVVARAAGVQAFARIAHQFHEAFFDVQVDVFEVEQPLKAARVYLGENLLHAPLNVGQILGGNDALGGQHVGMGQ